MKLVSYVVQYDFTSVKFTSWADMEKSIRRVGHDKIISIATYA